MKILGTLKYLFITGTKIIKYSVSDSHTFDTDSNLGTAFCGNAYPDPGKKLNLFRGHLKINKILFMDF